MTSQPRWDSSGGDPIKDIEEARKLAEQNTGYQPSYPELDRRIKRWAECLRKLWNKLTEEEKRSFFE